MNREDIIRMANEAELGQTIWVDDEDQEVNSVVRFAKLVAEAEREACAKLCDKEIEEWGWDADVVDVGAAIRARGQQ